MDASAWTDELPAAPKDIGGRPATTKTNRQVKVACGSCGFVAWTTRKCIERSRPECCGAPLELPRLADRAAVEWDVLEPELQAAGVVANNRAMQELGALDNVIAVDKDGRLASRDRKSGASPARCQWQGGYCAKFTSATYCPEHAQDRPAMGGAYKGR